MNENNKKRGEEYLFTCKDCGSHDLYVEHEYTLTRYYSYTWDCCCEKSSDGLAAMRSYHVTTAYREAGPLDDDHHWKYDNPAEEIEVYDEEEDESEISCEKCYDDAHENDWETTEDKVVEDEDSHEFYVRCNGCNREIEFGWSHPDRGGSIWPAECSDFNPWKCWAESRYIEKWKAKDWLRPDKDR